MKIWKSRSILTTMLAACACSALAATKKPPTPPAPISPVIAAAKTAFLSPVCEDTYPTCAKLYNELYAGLQQQGRFQLTGSPAQADIVLELHYVPRYQDATVSKGFVGGGINVARIMMRIIDRPTQYVLWSSSEPVSPTDIQAETQMELLLKDIAMVASEGATATIERHTPYR